MKKFTILLIISLLLFASCGPKNIGGTVSGNNVKILVSGWVNTPTDSNDPYKKYIKDKYSLNVTLQATSDFANLSVNSFTSPSTTPDIISFSDMTSFRRVFDQGVLLSDWTPWLEYMPNVKALVNKKDDDNLEKDSLTKRILSDGEELNAVWTIADPPTWSLKIREDWADEYRSTTVGGTTKHNSSYPAGNIATNGNPWQPNTPTDLLNFARWIQATKNSNQSNLNCFGFTNAGGGKDFGVLGTWIPLMYGRVGVMPWGMYLDDANNVNFAVQDGTHLKMLDFIKVLVREELIEPNWFLQSYGDKIKAKKGEIGIEWMPGSLESDCYIYNSKNGVDTSDWWKTYPVPCESGSNGGYMPTDSFFGKIITVSARTANDTEKMKKICKLIDDVVMTVDDSKEGKEKYIRTQTYDALRWGIGIEEGLSFVDMEGTDLVYIGYKQEQGEKQYYRTKMPGAWDWGSWFSVTSDGVIQGDEKMYTEINKKEAEHDSITASYSRRLQIGGAINVDAVKVQEIIDYQNTFEYQYVTSKNTITYAQFKNTWENNKGGLTLLEAAKREFIRLGITSAAVE